MVNNLFIRLKKYFNIQNLNIIKNKSFPNSKINSSNPNGFEYQIENPVLALLHESFQRYGYIQVASSSKQLPCELNEIVEKLKLKPMDLNNCPNYLLNCKTNEDVIKLLTKIYSSNLGAEYLHLNSTEEKKWFSDKFSNRDEFYKIDSKTKVDYLKLINRSEQFDIFLGKKFQSVKRYSGEGIESAMVCILEILKSASKLQMSNIVISMAHRGRNNLLTTLLQYPPVLYFRKMLGLSEFPSEIKFATGDTFSHYFYSTDFINENSAPVHISLIPNPSHLEANIPVAAGKVRSKMQSCSEGDYSLHAESRNGDSVLGIFVHGDASVYGQGIVPETLVMTDSLNFSIGGAIHIVINNQLGFTTETPNGIKNVTDVGKIVNCPIIHVNAHSVVDVAKAAMLAVDYRHVFRKDIFINVIGYRRWGHNELDDPTITQPIMYSRIASSQSISEQLTEQLLRDKSIESRDELSKDIDNWKNELNEDLMRAAVYEPPLLTFKSQWANQNILDTDMKSLGIYDTGFCVDKLRAIGECSIYVPTDFQVHPNVLRTHIQRRRDKLDSGEPGNIDWATAEALAVGSLLAEGVNCRLSGQDVGRGTFSHRHFIIVDQSTNTHCVPFNAAPWHDAIGPKRGYLEVANSILSEEAVLGFEIGMAMDNPNGLFIWEAQFGDFFNGAQILIDTYLGSAETKWLLQNGLVLLLPHGYDGAGPEHSSCRLERFLQLTDSSEVECDGDSVNMHVINPTTPAQYFHALRRQIVRPFKRPLIIASPKLLLRSNDAVSSLGDFGIGTFYRHVLPDTGVGSVAAVNTVLLCSGKHYYTLKQYLETSVSPGDRGRFAIIRIEQLAPFPSSELKEELGRFKNAHSYIWCQEEARNMGAWQFVSARVRNILGVDLEYAGRKELATPAVGIGSMHKNEIRNILETTFKL